MKKCAAIACVSLIICLLSTLSPHMAAQISRYVSAPLNALLCALGVGTLVIYILAAVFVRPHIVFALILALAVFALSWLPPTLTKQPPLQIATDEALINLCKNLTDDLNRASPIGIDTPAPNTACRIAQMAMDSPGAPIQVTFKAMRRLRLLGVYIPFAGISLVDASRSPCGLIFTASHELAHARGIADETAASLAAYNACTAYGGIAAYSAQLWALRYACARLNDLTPARSLEKSAYMDFLSLPDPSSAPACYLYLADMLANNMS